MIYRSLRLACYPNQRQSALLTLWAGARRFAFNKAIEGFSDADFLAVPWIARIPADVVRYGRKEVVQNKRSKARYKSRLTDANRFKVGGRGVKADDKSLTVPGLGRVRARGFAHYAGNVLNVTFTQVSPTKWEAAVLYGMNDPAPPKFNDSKPVGVDVGVDPLVALSTGQKIDNPHFAEESRENIAHLKSKTVGLTRGSNRWLKAQARVLDAQRAVVSRRKDHHHRLSRAIVNKFGLICCETLDGDQMNEICPSNRDAGMKLLLFFVEYKAAAAGKGYVQVDKWFASSKLCSKCGRKYEKLAKGEKNWTCGRCGFEHDRDVNGATNILVEGLRLARSKYTTGSPARAQSKGSGVDASRR